MVRHDFSEFLSLYFENNENNFYKKISKLVSRNETFIFLTEHSVICKLKDVVRFKGINLSFQKIENFSPLRNMDLIILNIHNNEISNIAPLENLVNLSYLSIQNNKISNIAPLENLVNLKTLILYNNQIKDISPLQNLTKLITLAIDHNQIEDLSPLQNLVNLQHLHLQNNEISNITPLEKLVNLTDLVIDSNKIELKELSMLSSKLDKLNYFYY